MIFTNNESISASQVFVPQKFSSLELVVIDIFLSTSATKSKFMLLFLSHRPPCHSHYSLDASILPNCVSACYLYTLSIQRYCYAVISSIALFLDNVDFFNLF